MRTTRFSIPASLALFSIWIFVFNLVVTDGYALAFLGLAADPTLLSALVCLELVLLSAWLWRQRIHFVGDPLELAGFLIVVAATWLYFVYPSWPTLLAPTYSGDAAVRYSETYHTFLTARIITDYPGGPALIGAMMARWIDWQPLRITYVLGACWIALTTGGIYGIVCSLLQPKALAKIAALFAPFALFVTWDYFAGILIGAHYFWPQVATQLFVVAFVWFLIEQLGNPNDIWSVGMALCLVGISVSFPLWLALPLGLLGWATWVRRNEAAPLRSPIIVGGALAAFWGASLLTGGEFIPNLSHFGTDGAAVIEPSLQSLGGAYLILPLLGAVVSLRRSGLAYLAAAFLILTVLQTLCLEVAHLLFGVGYYWVEKSFFVWAFPLAILAGLAVAAGMEWAFAKRPLPRPALAAAFSSAAILLSAVVFIHFPPSFASPLDESEIQVALWARDHLDTHQINYISRKGLIPQWLGAGLWGEDFPDDLWFGQPQLGPKTFEEWRGDPSWGQYLFVSSDQHFPVDRGLQIIYQQGTSMIISKTAAESRAASTRAPAGQFGQVLALVDYSLPKQVFRAGEVVSFTARIETLKVPAHQVIWRLQLRDLDHAAAAEARVDPFDDKFPIQRWPDGNLIEQPFTLAIPGDLRAGQFELYLGLYYVGSGEPLGCQLPDGTTDDVMSLGRIKVELPQPTTHELGSVTRVDLRVGDAITLLGYRLGARSPISPGDPVRLNLYWRSNAVPHQDYTVFVHLLDSSGLLRAQRDSAPRDGTYPTSIWAAGELVSDPVTLTLPRDAQPGAYRFEVGMYSWPSLRRLPVADANGVVLGDHLILPVVIQVVHR